MIVSRRASGYEAAVAQMRLNVSCKFEHCPVPHHTQYGISVWNKNISRHPVAFLGPVLCFSPVYLPIYLPSPLTLHGVPLIHLGSEPFLAVPDV